MINGITNYLFNPKPCSKVSFGAKPVPIGVAKDFERRIIEAKTITLFTHNKKRRSTDHDGLGSVIAIYLWLKSLGKEVSICLRKDDLKDLYFPLDKSALKRDTASSDLAMVFDCNGEERLSKKDLRILKKHSPENVLVIDHHKPMDIPIRGKQYLDKTAKSCCSIVYRLFECLRVKPDSLALKSLYCGMLSDYKKSKLVGFQNTPTGSRLVESWNLFRNKNSKYVLNRISHQVSAEDKAEIHQHLDILSNLSPLEKAFQARLFRSLRITSTGIAFVKIPFNDFLWKKIGGKNPRTAEILRDFRTKILQHDSTDEALNKLLTQAQKENLKHVKIVFIFYPAGNTYNVSAHSKGGLFGRLQESIPKTTPNFRVGGHDNRGGGSVDSNNPQEVRGFVTRITEAAGKICKRPKKTQNKE